MKRTFRLTFLIVFVALFAWIELIGPAFVPPMNVQAAPPTPTPPANTVHKGPIGESISLPPGIGPNAPFANPPAPPKFLTLPFDQSSGISLTNSRPTQGWWYNQDNAGNPYNHPPDPSNYQCQSNTFCHQAIDFLVSCSSSFDVRAAHDGLARSAYSSSWGNYVYVQQSISGANWFTLYAHLDSVGISSGTNVARGQVIGRAGKTGAANNCVHLHFELSVGGIGSPYRVDPYGVYGTSNYYPYPPSGQSSAWTTDPPSYPGGNNGGNCDPGSNEVSFYVDTGYNGQCVKKGINTYNDPGSIGLPNDSISSIKVGGNVKVKLCRDNNLGGTCEDFSGNDDNLSNNTIGDNQVSSAKVEDRNGGGNCDPSSNEVAFFADTGYGGKCAKRGVGTYNDPSSLGMDNDSISSIKVGGNAKVKLCRDNSLGGTCEDFQGDDDNLSNNSIGENQVSSAKVETRDGGGSCSNSNAGSDEITLFSDANYGGKCVHLGIADYGDPGQLSPVNNDDAESIKVGSNVKAILYENGGFDGGNETFESDDSNLNDNAIGSKTSSVRVQSRGGGNCNPNSDQVAVFDNFNYGGSCKTYDKGEYPSPDAMGFNNDSVSSIKVGGNVKVRLCGDSGYGGTCEDFLGDDDNLSNNSIGDNQVSSLKVQDRPGDGNCNPNADQVTIFENSGYSGSCRTYNIGGYPSPDAMGFNNDSASSLRVGGNVKVRLCRDSSFDGICEDFSSDDDNLSNNSIGDNQVSSLKVFSNVTDTEPPTASFINPVQGGYINTNQVQIQVSATDQPTGVKEVKFLVGYDDGVNWAWHDVNSDRDGSNGWQATWDASGLTDKKLAFWVYVYDEVGNQGQADIGEVRLDRTPPTSAIDNLPTQSPATFTVSWSGLDNLADISAYDVQYRDGTVGAWTDWQVGVQATSAQFTGLGSHTYYFQSRAHDKAGNIEAWPDIADTQTIVASVPGPFGKIGPANGTTGQPTNLTLSWESSEGADTYAYCIDDSLNSACDTSWINVGGDTSIDLQLMAGKTYVWQARALDDAGFVSADNQTWWSFTTQPSTENLIQNPGFEDDNDGNNIPDYWGGGNQKFTRSSDSQREGQYAGRIQAADDSNVKIKQGVNNISGDTTYDVSGWVNIPATGDSFTLVIRIRWLDSSGKVINAIRIGPKLHEGTSGWSQLSRSVNSPPSAASAKLILVAKSVNATIYLDAFEFKAH